MAMRKKSAVSLLSALILPAIVLIGGSAAISAIVSSERDKDFDASSIKRVAFLPFTAVGPGNGELTQCPVYNANHSACSILDHAESEFSRIMAHALYGSDIDIEWIDQSRINRARADLKQEGHPEFTRYGSWQRAIGKELSADAVLFGYIYCYRQRKGSQYASAEPAAMSFCLHLMDPQSGKILWSFRYHDEQKALFENLFNLPQFIQRGCKWITIQEMALEAVKETVDEAPLPKKEKQRKSN